VDEAVGGEAPGTPGVGAASPESSAGEAEPSVGAVGEAAGGQASGVSQTGREGREGPDDGAGDADDAGGPGSVLHPGAPDLDDLFARVRAGHTKDRGGERGKRGRRANRRSRGEDAGAASMVRGRAAGDARGDQPEGRRPGDAEVRTTWPTPGERAAARVTAARGPEAADEADDASVLRQRDAALEEVERTLSRRLKRVLADEENAVLDHLRRGVPEALDDVVPPEDDHVARYGGAAGEGLVAAGARGAELVGGSRARPPRAAGGRPDHDRLAGELGRALVEPLRQRIARTLDEGGDADEVSARLRALYREWKGQRIGIAVRHYAAAAYGAGALASVASGTELRWLVDRTGEPCPDADDNALATGVRKGDAFPTGDRCAPAHPGCRCLVVPAATPAPAVDAPAAG
jgi:hypothetical protein